MKFNTAEREKRWREDHLETFQERDWRPGSTVDSNQPELDTTLKVVQICTGTPRTWGSIKGSRSVAVAGRIPLTGSRRRPRFLRIQWESRCLLGRGARRSPVVSHTFSSTRNSCELAAAPQWTNAMCGELLNARVGSHTCER